MTPLDVRNTNLQVALHKIAVEDIYFFNEKKLLKQKFDSILYEICVLTSSKKKKIEIQFQISNYVQLLITDFYDRITWIRDLYMLRQSFTILNSLEINAPQKAVNKDMPHKALSKDAPQKALSKDILQKANWN